MRPLERLLLLTQLKTFLVVSVAWMRSRACARHAPVLAMPMAAAQVQ